MNTSDTIAAPASGTGGAITVIRISGPRAVETADAVWKGKRPLVCAEPRKMYLGKVGADPALAVCMKAPASYTGDDVVEIQCHGGAVAAENVLRRLLTAGCRMAEPGEFTFRAFINGKLDLAQAEAVADIVSSGSAAAFDLAQRQLAGALSARLNSLCDRVDALRSECEARLDFPDEELDLAPDEELAKNCAAVALEAEELLATREIGRQLREGVEAVIAGRPNAGKSSLLNRLLGYDRAIVSALPGTTRDTVEARTVLAGIPVILTDTAGLRESADPVEKLGVERSRRSIAASQVTLGVIDASGPSGGSALDELRKSGAKNLIAVWNKADLVPGFVPPPADLPQVTVSATTGEGMESLIDAFARVIHAGRGTGPLPDAAVNARMAGLLEQGLSSLKDAENRLAAGEHELAASDLAEASRKFGRTVGRTTSPDLLDAVFHKFCIGK